MAAGVLREPLWSFALLVGIAKTGRYLALAAVTLSWM
jgi:membrane protein YqaA with SNARE-associated domain